MRVLLIVIFLCLLAGDHADSLRQFAHQVVPNSPHHPSFLMRSNLTTFPIHFQEEGFHGYIQKSGKAHHYW